MVNLKSDKNNLEKWLEQKAEMRCTTCETIPREIYLKCGLRWRRMKTPVTLLVVYLWTTSPSLNFLTS